MCGVCVQDQKEDKERVRKEESRKDLYAERKRKREHPWTGEKGKGREGIRKDEQKRVDYTGKRTKNEGVYVRVYAYVRGEGDGCDGVKKHEGRAGRVHSRRKSLGYYYDKKKNKEGKKNLYIQESFHCLGRSTQERGTST